MSEKRYTHAYCSPDGLMGLAWPSISAITETPPFVNNLKTQDIILVEAEFGVKLADTGSELFLGGANTALTSGDFTDLPVSQEAFWQVAMDSVNVGGSSVVSGLQAIVDTGTSLIVGTPETVTKFYAAIPESKDASSTVGEGFFTCEF